MLDAADEMDLLTRWQTRSECSALQRLVQAYLPLVRGIARAYRTPGIGVDDLVQEGHLGLVQAIRRFDLSLGTRLGTYARWWITAYISSYVRRNRSVVSSGLPSPPRNTKNGKATAKPPKKEKSPGPSDIALDLSLPERPGLPIWSMLRDPGPAPDEIVVRDAEKKRQREGLLRGFEGLDDRERQILTARFLTDRPHTRAELGRQFALTGERIRQIETAALDKLRRRLDAIG